MYVRWQFIKDNNFILLHIKIKMDAYNMLTLTNDSGGEK